MHADELLLPWLDALLAEVPHLDVVDVHTHFGENDPDGYRSTPAELREGLALARARGIVFAMHEPGGYAAANDRILSEAAASDGALMPFCRVDPAADGTAEAERALAIGARGIKLHPRSEGFTLDHPGVEPLFALAGERGVPLLIHAGRGIPALGRHVLGLLDRHAGVRVVLAHAGVSDLAWIWREAPQYPSLFFDTSWAVPVDLLTLFALLPPGQILHASDAPYGAPVQNLVLTLRAAAQVGLTGEQIQAVCGGQARRLLAGEEPPQLGPAPGPPDGAFDPVLERLGGWLTATVNRMMAGDDGEEPLALARLACEVGDGAPQAPVCRSVAALIDLHDQYLAGRQALGERPRFPDLHVLTVAAMLAHAPAAALPSESSER